MDSSVKWKSGLHNITCALCYSLRFACALLCLSFDAGSISVCLVVAFYIKHYNAVQQYLFHLVQPKITFINKPFILRLFFGLSCVAPVGTK